MQSDEAVSLAVESCILADAERHMAELEPREGGKCWQCDNYHEIQVSDKLPQGLCRQLDFCGACVSDGSVIIVDRSEWHSADECWEEDTHG